MVEKACRVHAPADAAAFVVWGQDSRLLPAPGKGTGSVRQTPASSVA